LKLQRVWRLGDRAIAWNLDTEAAGSSQLVVADARVDRAHTQPAVWVEIEHGLIGQHAARATARNAAAMARVAAAQESRARIVGQSLDKAVRLVAHDDAGAARQRRHIVGSAATA